MHKEKMWVGLFGAVITMDRRIMETYGGDDASSLSQEVKFKLITVLTQFTAYQKIKETQ